MFKNLLHIDDSSKAFFVEASYQAELVVWHVLNVTTSPVFEALIKTSGRIPFFAYEE